MQTSQVLDIQHATYNLFGDPALRIAYPQPGMEIGPDWIWQPWKGSLAFHGKGGLPSRQRELIYFESLPGDVISREDHFKGTTDRYLHANNPVISRVNASIESSGNFSGEIIIPPDTPSGKYLLKAGSVRDDDTYVAAHPVYIGWPPIISSLFFNLHPEYNREDLIDAIIITNSQENLP